MKTEELTVRQNNLPTMPTEDVKQYVDVIGDAIDDMKAKLSAAKHLKWESTTIEQMTAQINEYSAMRIQAQIELGKRTAEMEKAVKGNQFTGKRSAQGTDKPKAEQLQEMNLPRQRANEYERMARHEDVVNRYIEEQIENGETPTKAGALNAIYKSFPKQKSVKETAQENIDRIKSADVIPLKAAEILKEEQAIIDREDAWEYFRSLSKILTALEQGAVEAFANSADTVDKQVAVRSLSRISECAAKQKFKIERSIR